jgi:SAM-dependent methyltransferase
LSGVLAALKRWGRQHPRLHRGWGHLRWWTSRRGSRELLRGLKYVGWSVQCSLCGWRGREFYPHADPHWRPNAQCPRCFSKERHRALFHYVRNHPEWITPGSRVLEIAPGFYSYRFFRQFPRVTYVGLDYSAAPARVRGDITRLPLPDATFDLVLCFHVLEHVVDDGPAMGELRRVLRDTGTALIQVPIDRDVTYEDPQITDPEARARLFGQPDHVRAYGHDIRERLPAHGDFSVQPEDMTAGLAEAEIKRAALVQPDMVLVCRPRLAGQTNGRPDPVLAPR